MRIFSSWIGLFLILYYVVGKYKARGQPWVSDLVEKEYYVYYDDVGDGSTLSPEQLAGLVTPTLSEDEIERGEDDVEFNILASLYDFGTETPEGEVEFNNADGAWNYGYDSLVWAMGIRGVGFGGKVYRDAYCMGVLIHPRIIMTLCSCINSWYRSYRNVAPGDDTDDMFEVSVTSDALIDIRAPTLFAHRNSWSGYLNRTGEMNYFAVSRQVLEYQKCTQAVEGEDTEEIVKQFETVAFLLLATSAGEHPEGSYYNRNIKRPRDFNHDAYYDISKEQFKLNAPSGLARKGWKYNVYSYYQEVQAVTPTDASKKKKENVDPIIYYPSRSTEKNPPGAKVYPERVDLARLLMGCQFEQRTPFKTGTYVSFPGKKHECWYEFMLGSYYEASLEPNINENYTKAVENELLKTHHIVCLVRDNDAKLCGFAPGSPLVHNGKLVGLLMTTFPDCLEFENLEKYFTITSVAVLAVLFTESSEVEPTAIGQDIEQDILNVIFAVNDKLKEEEEAADIEPVVDPSEEHIIDFVGHMDAEIRPIAREVLKADKELKLSGSLPVEDNPAEKKSMAAWVSPVLFPTSITVAAGLILI